MLQYVPGDTSRETLSWFYELPSNSVDCFRELADKFVNRFILRTDGQNTAQLFKINQDRGEGLKAFVNRWQDATVRVRNFDKKVAEEEFIQGLLIRKFMYAVKIECSQGYDELMEMAVRHAQADHDTYGGTSTGKRKVGEQEGGSPIQVVQEIRAWTGEQEPSSHPAGKSCIELKKTVERRIQEGKLQQYVSGPRHVGAIEVYGTINTIHGGSRIDNRSNKAKKQCTGSRNGRDVFVFGSSSNQRVTTGWKSVTFLEEEEEGIRRHEDPFLITLQLDHYITKKILVDTGASVNVLFRSGWKGLHRGSNKLIQDHEPLISFSGDVVQPLGSNSFGVSMEGREGVARATVEFIVVDYESSYNGILGRPALWKLKSFVVGHMLIMKVPTPTGIITIRGDQTAAKSCYAIDNGRKRFKVLLASQAMASPSDPFADPRDNTDSNEERPVSAEDTEMVSVSDEFLDRQVTIGTGQAPGVRAALISFLKKNSGAFAWTYKDMPEISSGIVTH
uniref:uncharacterized protein LOC101299850 n=1 Tax=Fragaria vesca subsp. vesca TaxID=101020 RepID=UPI0005C82C32|nr:PREDICTED: uncharacterized protein LOC101299850 [Fragaria vesca subsp. vesca]